MTVIEGSPPRETIGPDLSGMPHLEYTPQVGVGRLALDQGTAETLALTAARPSVPSPRAPTPDMEDDGLEIEPLPGALSDFLEGNENPQVAISGEPTGQLVEKTAVAMPENVMLISAESADALTTLGKLSAHDAEDVWQVMKLQRTGNAEPAAIEKRELSTQTDGGFIHMPPNHRMEMVFSHRIIKE